MDNLLTIEEAARILQVSESTLCNWDFTGKLRAIRTNGRFSYNLDEIRNFKSQTKKTNTFQTQQTQLVEKWQEKGYLEDAAMHEKEVLAAILENAELSFKDSSQFTLEQYLWLNQQGWLRSRFKKLISVQPMLGPTALATIRKSGVYEQFPVRAKITKYDFVLFKGVGFDHLKEVYANALATNLDAIILNNMPHQNIDILNSAAVLDDVEYVVGPQELSNKLNNINIDFYPVEIFNCESLSPVVVAGRYPVNRFKAPIFMPYLLLQCNVSGNGFIDIFLRSAWYS